MEKKIKSVTFWKRDPLDVSHLETLTVLFRDDGTSEWTREGKKERKGKEETASFLLGLKALSLEMASEGYRAYLYEEDPGDYRLHFFLVLRYTDATYLALPGLNPNQQPKYKEILRFFEGYGIR